MRATTVFVVTWVVLLVTAKVTEPVTVAVLGALAVTTSVNLTAWPAATGLADAVSVLPVPSWVTIGPGTAAVLLLAP